VVDEVALGQVFLCQCHSTVALHARIASWGWTVGSVRGHSAEICLTLSTWMTWSTVVYAVSFRFICRNAQRSPERERYDFHVSKEPFGYPASVNGFGKYVKSSWSPHSVHCDVLGNVCVDWAKSASFRYILILTQLFLYWHGEPRLHFFYLIYRMRSDRY
jgi:hypothetical protein